MKFHHLLFALCLAGWLLLAGQAPTAAIIHSHVPDGLTATDWAQIESQLAPEAITTFNEQAKLTADDATADDLFGVSVAVSGDTAVIGAQRDDDGGNDSGSAYVFVYSGGIWSQQAKLTASDSAPDDWFGFSVAISGNTAIVGALRGDTDDNNDSNTGSAYVFVRNGESWSEQAKLTASNAASADGFGYSVAVHNDTAIIGARFQGEFNSNVGSAYVFVRSGMSWSEQAILTASDAESFDWFGNSVAVSGDTAVVGAYGEGDDNTGSTNSGAAYIFVRSEENWTEQAKLTASDGVAEDQFGASVRISGDTAVIGAPSATNNGTGDGSAYVFVYSEGNWSEQAILTASDAATRDYFGASVAISGDTVVIGAFGDDDNGSDSGSAYVFALNNYPLAVATSGMGSGSIVSSPSGIDCGLNCEASFIMA